MSRLRIEQHLRRATSTGKALTPLSLVRDDSVTAATRALDLHGSAAAKRLAASVRRLAQHPTLAVVICGETGTGKTLLGRALHDLSPRRNEAFVRTDMTGLDREFAQSKLFGHLVGSFTGATRERIGDFPAAHRGSILLEEIGKADLAVQKQLLEAIEYGWVQPLGCERWFTVDVRVIALTNVPLSDLVREGRFLPDLQARLIGGMIRVPALRERRADIASLVDIYLKEAAHALRLVRPPTPSDEFIEACLRHDWPMNLRELSLTVHRSVLEAAGAPVVRLSHVPDVLPLGARRRRRNGRAQTAQVVDTYAASNENVDRTAVALGISRATVYRHLQKARSSGDAGADSTSRDPN